MITIEKVDDKFIITGDEDVLQLAKKVYHKHDLWNYDVGRVELLTLIELIHQYELAKKYKSASAAESYMKQKDIFLIGLNRLYRNVYAGTMKHHSRKS
ncbi:hypothetical protein V7166_20545 [Bacillus thuringiensis]